jgi:nucleoid-associated protein YgaU
MLINKGDITLDRRIGSGTMQIKSEGELSVADGSPDIAMLLSCDCTPVINEVWISDKGVGFSGKLSLDGLYLSGGEVKRVCAVSGSVPINDYINIDGVTENAFAYATAVPIGCDCRQAGERKLSYRVITEVSATVREQECFGYVESVGDIPPSQQRTERFMAETMPVHTSGNFTVHDTLTLPMGKPNIEELLSAYLLISSVDCKPTEDSMRVSGDINVSVLYKGEGESNPMELYEGTIPFKGELEANGLTADMLSDVRLDLRDCLVNAERDEDGERRLIDVEAVIGTYVTGRKTEEVTALADVYVLNTETVPEEQTVTGSLCVAHNMGQCPVKEVVTLDEKAPDMLQIYRVTGRPYVDFVETVDGKVNINGAVDVNILYVTGNDELPVYCCHGVVPFSHTAQATGAQAGMECSVDARLEHIGFNMLSGREVEIRCVVNIVTSVERECRYTLVGDVELKPLDKEYLNSLSSITLYVVRKGDTLWKIAKHFNTTVEDIVKVNDIDNPDLIYPGERLIVVKRTA